MSLLIKNGRVITASEDSIADIFIEGETIRAIGKNLPFKSNETIDATGKLVFPGGRAWAGVGVEERRAVD